MGTTKLILRHGKTFKGKRDFGDIQKLMDQVAKDIIDNGIDIVLTPKKESTTITFRYDQETKQKLAEIARNKGTCVNTLLQTCLEKMNLVTQQ